MSRLRRRVVNENQAGTDALAARSQRSRHPGAGLAAGLPVRDVIVGARFLWRLPGYLGYRIDVPEARAIVARRLERRGADFLALVRAAVVEQTGSPYRRLLALAGCEYGDLERLVEQDGVEGALRSLLREGIYLSVDEFKGRRPVVRGGASFRVQPDQFRNPLARVDLLRYRSGSRGLQTPVPIDLGSLRDRSVNLCLTLQARGGIGWQHAGWEVPGGASMVHVLECHPFDRPPVRWFTQLDPATPGLHPRYRWSERLMRWTARVSGVPFPRAEYVPLDDPEPIVRWLREVREAGGTPHLKTYASSAVRLCQKALALGLDLRGVQLTVTGEPVTETRLAAIRRTGAQAVPRCGTSEAGVLGSGCLAPEASDDLHFFHDLNAAIRPGPDAAARDGLSPRTLLLSSLRVTARLVLLNVSLGDEAELTQRACGCPMGEPGWTTHLHTIRSPEKLTSAGMSFLDADVIRVLEEVLPARFGGGPTHYQLVEEEAEDGQARLRLIIDPSVGVTDPGAVADAFLAAMGPGSGSERLMGFLWREARLLRAEVGLPLPTAAGKILHLHRTPPRGQPATGGAGAR